jgi:hypothetical protein
MRTLKLHFPDEALPTFPPFAPSGPNCLNFKLPIESRPQAQPL